MKKWTFFDGTVTYQHQINPNQMSSPFPPNKTNVLTKGSDGQNRVFRANAGGHEWTFGGVVRSEQQYDDLLAWSQKPGKVDVTDHLGRTWQVLFLEFVPDEQRPTAKNAWRFNYTMRALVLGRAYPGSPTDNTAMVDTIDVVWTPGPPMDQVGLVDTVLAEVPRWMVVM